MPKFFYCYTFLILCATGQGQDTLNSEMVANFSTNFSINNYELEGPGAKVLHSEFAKSQFVLLGETHGISEISIFTTAIIPILKEYGFEQFYTETGASSLKLMMERVHKHDSIPIGIKAFYDKELARNPSGLPIPFLWSFEDARFIDAALKSDIKIYGIDQEHYNSFLLLFDELQEGGSNDTNLNFRYAENRRFLQQEYELGRQNKTHPMCFNLLNSSKLRDYLEIKSASSSTSKIIIDNLIESWSIYELNSSAIRQSYVRRGALMRDRFLSYYEEEQAMGRPAPKVLIKLGALHTQRGTNVLGINDIGDQVQQIAKTRGSRDLNLYFMFRYFADEEEPLGYFDNSDNNSNWVLERKPFTSQGKLLEWTLIDLKALNAFIIQNELYVSPPLKVILKTRDYVLLPPVAHDALPNFRKN